MQNLFVVWMLLFLSSCSGAIVGTIGGGSYLVPKHNYTVLPSKKVYNTQKEINELLKNNNNPTKDFTLVQNRNSVYAIGVVKSSVIKDRVIEILNNKMHGQYVDEISVSASGRNYFKDLSIKIKIRNDLLFTKYVKSSNYKIIVFNKKAFIIGTSSNDNERDIVVKVLQNIDYIEDIIVYITNV